MEAWLADERTRPALYMVWSRDWMLTPPRVMLGDAYELRLYHHSDEQQLYPLFHAEGWHIAQRDWQDYLDRVIPNGLFVLWHRPSALPMGTAGAIHNPRAGRYYFPFGGELAYLVVHPEHRGQGLGTALSLQVVQRLLDAGYETLWLGVQGFRLAAINIYLRLGFRPLLHQSELAERWQRICEHIAWPYETGRWPRTVPGGATL